MLKKASIGVAVIVAALAASQPANAAFVVGGLNGWELSTDGIVDFYTTYASTQKLPDQNAKRGLSLLSTGGNETKTDDRFGTGIGLLPSVIALNVKAPTTNGVDSKVRVGIYPASQNGDQFAGQSNKRFSTSPNIDLREFFYTAKGTYGELLIGRALNLFQGKNILTDMTLLGAGVTPGNGFHTNTTLGHIGYGYLYTNFGPQVRYTTPDLNGIRVAVEIAEPYKVSKDSAMLNSPRLETEISYAGKVGNTAVQAWLSGLYQNAKRSDTATVRAGVSEQSIGGAAGASASFNNGLGLMLSGYTGKGLGMTSVQDGDFLGSTSTDDAGETRTQYGFLAQATYQVTPVVNIGLNFGRTMQNNGNTSSGSIPVKTQEAATTSVTYSFNSFTKFTGEYTYAQNTWQDGAKQHSNQFALGSTFFW